MNWTATWPANNPLKGIHQRLLWIAPVFCIAMGMYGSKALVNYGSDGKHSAKTAHGDGRALDIHHKDLRFPWAKDLFGLTWQMAAAHLFETLADICNKLERAVNSNVEYYLVLEASHLHMEITLKGEAPNIKGWVKGKYFYTTSEVETIMKAPAT